MIKALETAIAKVRALPEDKQQLAAELLEELAAVEVPYALSDAESAAVREGLANADRGEFASDEDVENMLRRPSG